MTITLAKSNESPKGWYTTTLGSLVSFEYGKGLVKNLRDSRGEVPVYGSNGIVGYHSEALTDKPCIIVGRKGAIGRVHISKVKCWPIDTTYYIEPSNELELSFVYYLLLSLRLDSYDRSTAIPGLNRDDAYAVEVAIPPSNEQKRIVSKLEELFTKLDAGIEYLKKTQILLNQYHQSVLKYAFEGKLTKNWRDKHSDKITRVSDQLEFLKNQNSKYRKRDFPAVESENLHELPREWMWIRVQDIVNSIQYGTSEKADNDSTGIPVIRMGNIQDGKIIFDNLKYYQDSQWLGEFLLSEGDILFNRTNSAELVGKSAVYEPFYPKSVFASYLIRLKTLKDQYNPKLLSFFINSIFGKKYIGSVVSQQVGQANVNGTKLAAMPIPFLSISEQNELVQEIETRLSIMVHIEDLLQKTQYYCRALRQSILKIAFEGKLVPQDPNDEPAEIMLERIKNERRARNPVIKEKPKKTKMKAIDNTKQTRMV